MTTVYGGDMSLCIDGKPADSCVETIYYDNRVGKSHQKQFNKENV